MRRFSKHSMSSIEALIFDCDGTVLNSMEFYWPTWVETCKKYKIHITKRKFYECSGKNFNFTFLIISSSTYVKLLRSSRENDLSNVDKRAKS